MNGSVEEHLQMVADCENRESRLDEWSARFIDSIRAQLDKDRSLTQPQEEKLEEIWERATAKG